MTKEIDFVITWVNGNDKDWLDKKNFYLNQEEKNKNFNNNGSNVRYRDYGTLKYLLRGIDKYATWVHKIYIITDNQVPDWLNTKNKKIKIIDHKDIINSKYLPVFNSNAIEWNIDNIANLSENFVYFNDDMLLNRKVNSEDFFKNDKPCDCRIYSDIIPTEDFYHIPLNNTILINDYVKGNWPISKTGLVSLKNGIKQFTNLIFLLQAKKRGIPGYMQTHGPIPFSKNSFMQVKAIWKKEIESTLKHRFRSLSDISIWLVRQFQLETGEFVPRKYDFDKIFSMGQFDAIKDCLEKSKSGTICINDEEGIDPTNIIKVLNKKFPNKSIFEK